jgi:hypothetical protein
MSAEGQYTSVLILSIREIEKEKKKTFRWIFLRGFFSDFCELGPVQTPHPLAGRGGGWESESLRVFKTR